MRIPLSRPIIASLWLVTQPLPATAESLMQLWEHVVENNPTLKVSEYLVDQAKAGQDQAMAKLRPQVAIKGYYSFNSYNRNAAGKVGFNLMGGANQEYGGYNGSFSISQALFDLPTWHRVQGAQKQTHQQEQSALAQRMELAYKLVDEYLGVLEASDTIAQFDAEIDYTSTQVGRLSKMLAAQMVQVTDLYEMEAYGQSLETARIEADHQRSIGIEKIREISGIAIQRPEPLARDDFPELNRPADDWAQEALSANPVLLALEYASESAQDMIQSSQAEHLPSASVSASETVANTLYNNVPVNVVGFTGYNVGALYLNVNIPLYSGGGTEAGVRESVQRYHITREKIEQARRAIEKDTRTAWFNTESGRSRIGSTRKEMTAREKVRQAQATRYEVGAATLVDVLDAHRKLLKSHTDYSKARYDYIRSLIRLRLNAGSLADLDIETISAWFAQDSELTIAGQGRVPDQLPVSMGRSSPGH